MFLKNKINQIKKINSLVLSLMLFLETSYIWALQKDDLSLLNYTLSILSKKKLPKVKPTASLQITDKGKQEINKLLNDFNYYITSNIIFHAGDLYQHSVWTANAIEKFWKDNEFWVEGIDQNDKNLTIFAGLIHDIGKGEI